MDDDPAFAVLLQLCLRQGRGIRVVGVAPSLGVGVKLLGATGPDVVILDVHLPDGNVRQAVRRMRSISGGVVVVLVSADATDAEIEAGLLEGATAYLPKGECIPAIRRVVHEAHLRDGRERRATRAGDSRLTR